MEPREAGSRYLWGETKALSEILLSPKVAEKASAHFGPVHVMSNAETCSKESEGQEMQLQESRIQHIMQEKDITNVRGTDGSAKASTV